MVALAVALSSMDKPSSSLQSLQRKVSELTATYHGRGWTTETADLEHAIEKAGKRILADDSDPITITLDELNACVKRWLQAKSWIVAEDLGILVLTTCEKLKGEEDSMTLTAMNNLASAYCCAGSWSRRRYWQPELRV